MARGSCLQSTVVLFLVLTAVFVAHNVVIHMLRVNGGYTSWSEFSQCTVSCGGGTRQRWRLCTNPLPRYGGKNCSHFGPDNQIFRCNLLPCPVHGGYGSWSGFSSCSKSCGGGVSKRARQCDNPKPQYGGKSCKERELGADEETKSCNTHPCPINGGYSEWSEFNTCTVTCGGGIQTRSRLCDKPLPQHGGKNCSELGTALETKVCNSNPCPVDGGFGAWSSYGACSVTCGAGIKTRSRKCDNPKPENGGKGCEGPESETMSCSEASCPVDGAYSEWSEYSSCSVTCGEGTRHRQRTCNNPAPSSGRKSCFEKGLGPDFQTIACSGPPCTTQAANQNSPMSGKKAQIKTERPTSTVKQEESESGNEARELQENKTDASVKREREERERKENSSAEH